MVPQKINREMIRRICYYLEFYDKYGVLPFERRRIDITLSNETIEKLKRIKNKSKFIEGLINKK